MYVLFHRGQDTRLTLNAVVIVVSNVVLNYGYKFLTACESSAAVPFPFEDAPETFRQSIVNALVKPCLHLHIPKRNNPHSQSGEERMWGLLGKRSAFEEIYLKKIMYVMVPPQNMETDRFPAATKPSQF